MALSRAGVLTFTSIQVDATGDLQTKTASEPVAGGDYPEQDMENG
jgi:hypothetical protein